jgi:hypothetical protein
VNDVEKSVSRYEHIITLKCDCMSISNLDLHLQNCVEWHNIQDNYRAAVHSRRDYLITNLQSEALICNLCFKVLVTCIVA